MRPKRINLALQGGGAHGAFTWGVLDRLLQEPEIEIAAMSGTSAGALNGAAVKCGLVAGSREGARDNLAWLWEQVGGLEDGHLDSWWHNPGPGLVSKVIEHSPPYVMADAFSRFSSPYVLGPLYQNPLHRIVDRFKYDAVCASEGPRFFVCATNVRTGKIRIFTGHEISNDAIMASACLPTMFKAVEIDDPATGQREAYWDGGYTGNPALFPFFERDLPPDLVVININPLHRADLPVTPQAIQNRINEISFNSSLLRELRAIHFVQRLLDEGKVDESAMKRLYVHMIADDELMNDLSVATKLVPSKYVIDKLFNAGQAACAQFLDRDAPLLGRADSVDLVEMFS